MRNAPAPSGAKAVVLAIRMAGVPGRRKLAGVFRYLEEHQEHWDIRLVRTREYFTKTFVEAFAPSGVDGVIASFPDAREAGSALVRSGIPVVMLDPRGGETFPSKRPNLAWIQSDSVEIGRAAATHLLAQGRFASYGYVHDRALSSWSAERAAAFAAATGGCAAFSGRSQSPDGYFKSLCAWLAKLPKPSGVMVAFDDQAILVIEACRRAKISVPGDVAIVSCDNDELICNHLSPGLSSVEADFNHIGYRAAELLSAMMRSPAPLPAVRETYGGTRLAVRGSSAPMSSGGALVARAMAFIDRNAASGIGVRDVVGHLKVSRRLADLRFREIRGMSISDAIRDRRLEAAKDLLAHTDEKMESIAVKCGFSDAKHLMTVFRKREGCSMREWRASAGKAGRT